MLRNNWTEIKYQLDICHAARGEHVEIGCQDKIFGEFLHLSSQTACMYLHWE
jgi:hypothetical protein